MTNREIVRDIFDRLLSDNEEENETAKKDLEEIASCIVEFIDNIEGKND